MNANVARTAQSGQSAQSAMSSNVNEVAVSTAQRVARIVAVSGSQAVAVIDSHARDSAEGRIEIGALMKIETPRYGLGRRYSVDGRLANEDGRRRAVGRACFAPCSRCQGQHVTNIVLAIARRQRHRDALAADHRITALGALEGFAQHRCGLKIARSQNAARRAHHIRVLKHGVPAGVGVDDAARRVDDKQTGR